jgi:tetratricopeptide (TPR) repeat protein
MQIRKGDDFEVCNLIGIAKFQLGHVDEASRWFEKALRLNPTDSDTLMNYYDCMLRLGVPQQAMRPMEYALSLNPELHEVQLALQEVKVSGTQGIADPLLVIQNRELNINAENLIREGMPDKARELLNDIVRKQPKNYRALNNLGLLSWYAQDMQKSWDLFLEAFQSNPWYIDAVVNLYDCAFLSHRLEEFLPILAKAMAVNPGSPELLQIETEIREGKTPIRLQVYFRKDAEQTRLREQIDLGQKMLDEQKVDSAVMIFTDLLNDYPDNVECLNGVGIVAFYRGDYDDAYSIFQHALQVSPLDGDTLVNIWDAAQKCDKIPEAKAILQNALAVDPSLTVVAEILEGC